ncbi:aromatic amino acid aminotransferase [Neokomagataea thailandica NBRC 106555]|nr:aromatic amino acid aminotransferase [Neokomagataea thailandica NBRC 106555]
MRAIKAAEERLLASQKSKSYLGPEGDKGFVKAIAALLFGSSLPDRFIDGIQTPGGTGALRLAAELLVRSGVKRIFLASPTWANHNAIFRQVGLEIIAIPCFDIINQSFNLAGFIDTLATASSGDAVLLHGCCHNPLGIDPTPDEWGIIAQHIAKLNLLPLIDIAYQGLGSGWSEDAFGLQTVLAAAPFGILTYSCDKNFGLYRERTGAVYVTSPDQEQLDCILSNILCLARTNWSMPPDHGAALVRLILEDKELTHLWRTELEEMRRRTLSLREDLARLGQVGHINLAPLTQGKGMFATLPLSPNQVEWLRSQHAIYMAHSGRINIAGFRDGDVERFGTALKSLIAAGVA